MSRVLKIWRRRAVAGILEVMMIVLLGAMTSAWADQSTEQAERVRAELQTIGEEYIAAYNRHDAAAVASFSTDNSELIKWSGDIVRGKDNIQRFFEQTFRDNPDLHMENHLESAHLVNVNAVMTFGTLKFTGNSKNWPSESKFAVLWEKVDGRWKALFDAGFVTTRPEH
jgi:uncharacterized protein (TIGR02246 family)